MSPDDARARIDSQPRRQDRLEGADLVVDNSGDHDHLRTEVDRVWAALEALRDHRDAAPPAPPPDS
jgi:dephospho-CoA kinase